MSPKIALVVFIARLLGSHTNHHVKMANTYAPMILEEMDAANSDLSPKLISAMIMAESSFDAKGESHKGAVGLMGIMPSDPHARKYTKAQLFNPRLNIRLGLKIIEDSRNDCRRIVENELGYIDPRIWLSRYAGYGCQESIYADQILATILRIDNS